MLGSARPRVTDRRDGVRGLADDHGATLARHRRGPVGTGVIDNENLNGRAALRRHDLSGRAETVEGLRNAALLVERRDDHRDRWQRDERASGSDP